MRTILSLLACALFFPAAAFAEGDASLYLSPNTGKYPIGEPFKVSVLIDTAGADITTAEGKISFNKDEIEVASLSKDGSVLSSWSEEPSFSNKEGYISFSGISTNPYKGSDGKILDVTFRALKNKSSTIRFAAGAAIIAADGAGTNILTSLNPGVYELTPKEIMPVLAVESTGESAALFAATSTPFEVFSSTHPDRTMWYSTTTASFSWMLPLDATEVLFAMNTKPTSTPKTSYPPTELSKTFKKIPEGVNYFHIVPVTPSNDIPAVHYRVAVDYASPTSFEIYEAFRDAYGFRFIASDALSGIGRYEVGIDEEPLVSWTDDGTHVYIPEKMTSGDHTLHAKAYDRAGNYIERSFPFNIPVVETPVLKSGTEAIAAGGTLSVSYVAGENAKVTVYVQKDDSAIESGPAVKKMNGRYVFTLDHDAEKGKYAIWAIASLKGVESKPSPKAIIEAKSAFFVVGGKILSETFGMAPRIFLVTFFAFVLFYFWQRRYSPKTPVKEGASRTAPSASAFSPKQNVIVLQKNSVPPAIPGATKLDVRSIK